MVYRIYRERWYVGQVCGNSYEGSSNEGYKPTTLTVKARSEKEAMRKADKLWRECEFGTGSIIVKPENPVALGK